MSVQTPQDHGQPDRPERYTRRLDQPPTPPTTRAQLLDALLVERFGTPTPEHHNKPGIPLPMPAALRLVVDNQLGLFDADEQVA